MFCSDAIHKARFATLPPGLQADVQLQTTFTKILGLSVADATYAKYKPAWEFFTQWLLSYGIFDPFSACVDIIALFATHLISTAQLKHIGDSGLSNSLAAINFFYALAGKPSFDSPYIVRLRKAAGRMLQPRRSLCEPISASDLHKVLLRHLTPTCSLLVRMHLTVFLLMFLGLFRFNDIQQIFVHQDCMRFICNSDQTLAGVLIFIPFSKTDQTGEGVWVAIGATGKQFCPVRLLSQLLHAGKYCTCPSTGMVAGPLLRAVVARHQPERFELAQVIAPSIPPLSYSAFRTSILTLAKVCLDKHFGLHSLRAGGASAAAELGIDSRLVCALGRWKQGTTFADTYVKMMHGNMFRFFELTKELWPF